MFVYLSVCSVSFVYYVVSELFVKMFCFMFIVCGSFVVKFYCVV